MIGTYACVVCGQVFTVDRKGGRAPTACSVECKAEQNRRKARQWHRDNPDKAHAYKVTNADRIREYNRAYYAKDPEAEKARSRAWQQANPERVAIIKQREKDSGKPRERAARFRRENPELFRERLRTAYWNDPDRARERVAQWSRDNPEKARLLWARNNRRRKAAIRGAKDLEPIDPGAIYDRDGWICQLCGDVIDPLLKFPDRLSASIDHIVPISKGGQHTVENVQAAHYSCNSSKRDRI